MSLSQCTHIGLDPSQHINIFNMRTWNTFMCCVICILATELYQGLLNSIFKLFRELYTAARIRILHSTLYTPEQHSYIGIYLYVVYVRILYRGAHE